MRINVYDEEITGETEWVEKVATNTGDKFYGIRLFLKSPDALHNTEIDDDRSAITLWFARDHLIEAQSLFRAMGQRAAQCSAVISDAR